MSTIRPEMNSDVSLIHPVSEGERIEMKLLGLLDEQGNPRRISEAKRNYQAKPSVRKQAITNEGVLNEAFDYAKPSSFSRGLRVDLRAGSSFLLISGTASVDENGETVYVGDFRAQCWRTWRNITELLKSQDANWHDIVRTTCYLRDIERDYRDFNEVRTYFFKTQNLEPLPASTAIQARICREDLLVEIEAIAILDREAPGS